jgi:adenylate cyclase
VVALLNNYLGVMSDVVAEHGGTVDEFIGDAILAIFGAPVRGDADARHAVACAVAMQRAMAEVNARNHEAALPRVEMGIGIDTGVVVVGNIGSARRAKYGVVGDHVNLTARIAARAAGGQILASAATVGDAGAGVRHGAPMQLELKGVRAPTTVHELLGTEW